jgi:hypothetical protein
MLVSRYNLNSKGINRYLMHANNLTAPTTFNSSLVQQPNATVSGIESSLSNLIAGAIWGG